jgi:hypothetical protein
MNSRQRNTTYRARASSSDWLSGGEWITDTIRRRPEALLLIGAGVALMMRGQAGRTQVRYVDREGHRTGPEGFARNEYAREMSRRSEQMRERADDWRSRASEQAGRVSDTVRRTSEDMSERARGSMQQASDMAHDASESMTGCA